MALNKVETISLSKQFLLDNLFRKYPKIAHKIK